VVFALKMLEEWIGAKKWCSVAPNFGAPFLGVILQNNTIHTKTKPPPKQATTTFVPSISAVSVSMIVNPATTNNNGPTNKRGAFILLEGVDRCGKTTQVSLLVKHLLSLSLATVAYRFPDRTTQGDLILV
jgi:hypothetical protein